MLFVPELEEVGVHLLPPPYPRTAKGTQNFSTLACKVGQTQREQVALGISAACAHGSVACWGSGRAVCTS